MTAFLFTGTNLVEGAAAAAGIRRTRLFNSPTRTSGKQSARGIAQGRTLESLSAETVQNRKRVSWWCILVCAVLLYLTFASLSGPLVIDRVTVVYASEVLPHDAFRESGWGGHYAAKEEEDKAASAKRKEEHDKAAAVKEYNAADNKRKKEQDKAADAKRKAEQEKAAVVKKESEDKAAAAKKKEEQVKATAAKRQEEDDKAAAGPSSDKGKKGPKLGRFIY
jgi:hypothetical protein